MWYSKKAVANGRRFGQEKSIESWHEKQCKSFFEKNLIFLKKRLDKNKKMCYSKKAVANDKKN